MRVDCKECNGTGYTGMHGRTEDAEVCCDGAVFYCDMCEEEHQEGHLEEVDEDTHLCDKCFNEE